MANYMLVNYNANEIAVIYTDNDTVSKTIPVAPHPYTVRVDPVSNTVLGNKSCRKQTYIHIFIYR